MPGPQVASTVKRAMDGDVTPDVPLDPAMAAAMARRKELDRRFPAARSLEEQRQNEQAIAPAWAAGAPEVGAVEPYAVPTEDGHKPALLVRPAGVERPPLTVLIHGGGWKKGSIAQSVWLQNSLCAASGHAVLSVSYRLVPEHPYPAGLNDVAAAYDWAFAMRDVLGLSAAAPTVGGASAGANLALAVTLLRRRQGKTPPSGLLLFYGVLGADLDTPSYTAFGDGRFGLSRAQMANSFDAYVGKNGNRNDPLVSPLNADLGGLPPVWLATAELDVLRDDTLRLAAKLQAAGVTHTLVRGHGLVHGYCNRGNKVPRVAEIVGEAGRFLAALAR